MSIVQKIDEWLMSSVFEPLAWRIESRFEFIDNFRIAIICHFLSGAMFAIISSIAAGVGFALHMVVVVSFTSFMTWQDMTNEIRRPHAARNPGRDDWVGRVAAIGICATLVLVFGRVFVESGKIDTNRCTVLLATSWVFLCSYRYFRSCDRMPPGYTEEEKSLVPSLA